MKGITSSFFGRLAVTSVLLIGLGSAVRAEDAALVIGVNQYPGLRAGANLGGCVNDANLMRETLGKYGFRNITVLTDGQAGKQAILSAIGRLKQTVRPGERVVVYFAGHGTINSNGDAVILPNDAQDNDESRDITVSEFYDAVKALPGTRTVMLDSCHSGGMARSLRPYKGRTARYYVRSRNIRDTKKWQEDEVNDADEVKDVIKVDPAPVGTDPICFFTAALKTQTAGEAVMPGGQRHGIFTYFAAQTLKGGREIWRDVAAAVTNSVGQATDEEQRPLLYPTDMFPRVVFGGKGTPQPKPFNLVDVYGLTNPDPNAVSLKRFPDRTPVPVGTATYFEITVNKDGYLLLLNRDPKAELYLVYPKAPTLEAMRVRAGQKIRVPAAANRVVRPDTPGVDGLKAILFTDSAPAMAMLKPFISGSSLVTEGVPERTAKTKWREWKEDDADTGANFFFTSELTTLIVPKDSGATP